MTDRPKGCVTIEEHIAKIEKDPEKKARLDDARLEMIPRFLHYDLMGVIADVEQGAGFDDVCLATVKRVATRLHDLAELAEAVRIRNGGRQ